MSETIVIGLVGLSMCSQAVSTLDIGSRRAAMARFRSIPRPAGIGISPDALAIGRQV
jgi:hypothetical protein